MSVLTHLCGGVTSASAVLKARVSTGSSVRVLLAQFPVPFGPETPDGNGMVTFNLSNLTPLTEYTGVYEIDGVPDTSRVFRFSTLPVEGKPASFRFTAFNCLGNPSQSGYSVPGLERGGFSNSPAFAHVLDRNPLFNIIAGDWGYYDVTEADRQEWFRQAWLDNLSQPNQQLLMDRVPLVYMYDDHDGPGNNSDKTSPSVPAMLANYREQMPCYPIQPSGPTHHSFMCGRVLFIIGDGRAERDPNSAPQSPDKSMLGEDQRDWMIDLLETTRAAAVVWVISSIWHSGSGSGDNWGSFTHERDIIASVISDYRARGGVFVAINGDNHSMGIEGGENNLWGGFPVLHFGAFDCPYNHSASWSLGYIGGFGNYGTVDVEDDGTGIALVATGWSNTRRWRSLRVSVPEGYSQPGTYSVRNRELGAL